MDYKQIFILVFLFLSVFSLSSIRFLEEKMHYGEEMELHSNIVNNDPEDSKDIRVVGYIPELGVMIRGTAFDVQDNYGKFLWWDIPQDVQEGDYLVKITASNDDFRTSKYRYIHIY